MRSTSVMKAGFIAGLTLGVTIASSQIQLAQQQAPAAAPAAAQAGRGGQRGPDPRAQQRTHLFAETNEQMPYALYVSSKVTKDKKNPLIVALHGLSGTQNTMVGASYGAIDLAEQGGYIYLSPMGYNCSGWFGAGAPGGGGARRGAAGPGAGASPAAAPQAAAPQGAAPQAGAPQRGTGGRGGGCVGGGTAVTDAAKVREMSEKETMQVLDLVRKEFNVDERRIYLFGHSMGGAGTYHLASKYPNIWAAIGPVAPAAMGMTNDRVKILQSIKDAGVPVLVSMGDADEVVPVASVRTWVDTMKELQMNYEYKEYPGITHGPIIGASMADVFKFFDKHSKR
ncbi:MAG TPA: dienelactone hydrolase family protein [Terriglobia bacterium]|nr:dienelactone hydrolase family protein [Terriglobia bacterium]